MIDSVQREDIEYHSCAVDKNTPPLNGHSERAGKPKRIPGGHLPQHQVAHSDEHHPRHIEPDVCIDAIKDYILVRDEYAPEGEDAEKALFLSRKHKRMSVDSIQYLMDHICKKAGIEHYSPHKLRHTAATIMVNNGADIMEIKEVLGHENVQTSTIYSHLSQQNLDVVVSKCGFNNTLEKAKKQERKNRSKEDPKK